MPLEIVRNDITLMKVDAIVNAANNSLLGGGGVDGAIHRAAGPMLLEECRTLGGCETGDAKLTKAYELPCKYVIHTVGPIWQGGGAGERALLASCYRKSLELAREWKCESLAFPLISAGAYGYPKAEAMQVALETIAAFLLENEMLVYLVVFGRDVTQIGGRLFREVTAYIDDVYVEEHMDYRREAMRRQAPALWKPAPEARPCGAESFAEAVCADCAAMPGLDELLDRVEESFSEMLLRKIDESRMTDAQCYKRANIDRRLFNKIKNNPGYKPGKPTVMAFAIALQLTLEEARELLMKAGFALSRSNKVDIVVEYCIRSGNYDILEINSVLFSLDLPPLGY